MEAEDALAYHIKVTDLPLVSLVLLVQAFHQESLPSNLLRVHKSVKHMIDLQLKLRLFFYGIVSHVVQSTDEHLHLEYTLEVVDSFRVRTQVDQQLLSFFEVPVHQKAEHAVVDAILLTSLVQRFNALFQLLLCFN